MSWLKQAKRKVYYRVRLRWQNNDFEETIETNSAAGAKNACKARFPGCLIRKVVRHAQ